MKICVVQNDEEVIRDMTPEELESYNEFLERVKSYSEDQEEEE